MSAPAEMDGPPSASGSRFSRRAFLATTVGSCVTFGFAAPAVGSFTENPQPAPAPGPSGGPGPSFAPDVWYTMDSGGKVTFNIINSEMGQHIGTALSRIFAEELEVEWADVAIVTVDSDPKWGEMMTGGSYSVFMDFKPISQLAAAGRMALIKAGAGIMGVAEQSCTASKGFVISGDRKISYADIVGSGRLKNVRFTKEQVGKMPLKPASQRNLLGKSVPAWDVKSKTNGTAVYGFDAEVPGMVYCCPVMPPTRYDSTVVAVDDSAAKSIKGYQGFLKIEDPSQTVIGWVVAVADTLYAAWVAASRIKVQWQNGPAISVSEKDLLDFGLKAVADPNRGAIQKIEPSDPTAAFAQAKTVIEATYTTSTVLHVQMEPVNALAFEKDGIFEIHTGSQWQTFGIQVLAKALQRPESSIVMRTYLLGGAFGRRLDPDYAVAAALIAKALGKPAKLVFTRPDDIRFDTPRMPTVQRLRLAVDGNKTITGMEFRVCSAWPAAWSGKGDLKKGVKGRSYDTFGSNAADHWYNVGPNRVRTIANDLANKAFRPGYLRSVGAGYTTFALESMIDEAAHALGYDPYDFRLSLLKPVGRNVGKAPESVGGAARQANALKILASKVDLKASLPPDTAIGIASSAGQERAMPTWIACAVQVHLDRATGDTTVQRIDLVVDCGTVIDPDGALAQVQGASLWGLSLALFEGTEIVNGAPRDTNFHMYSPLRINKVPELNVHFVESTETPTGLGEPGLVAIAPAIANALHKIAGIRMRHLPMRPEAIRAALAEKESAKPA